MTELSDDPMWGTLRTITLARTLASHDSPVTVAPWVLRDLVGRIDALTDLASRVCCAVDDERCEVSSQLRALIDFTPEPSDV